MVDNYFTFMQLPLRFNIDKKLLQQRYYDLQRQFHPDRLGHCGVLEKSQAMQTTTYLNNAYQTLKQPVSRAIYLLKLSGVDMNINASLIDDEVFLNEQLMWREQLDTLEKTDGAIGAIKTNIKIRMTQLEQRLSELFAKKEKLNVNISEEIKQVIMRLHFFVKLKRQINCG